MRSLLNRLGFAVYNVVLSFLQLTISKLLLTA
jgi:hypothetical protein